MNAEKVVKEPKNPIAKKLFKNKELPSSWFAMKNPIAKHPNTLTNIVPNGMLKKMNWEK